MKGVKGPKTMAKDKLLCRLDMATFDVKDPEVGDQVLGELRDGAPERLLRDLPLGAFPGNGGREFGDRDAGDQERGIGLGEDRVEASGARLKMVAFDQSAGIQKVG